MELKRILRKPKQEKTPTSDFKALKLLITVVNKNKTEFYTDFLNGFESNFQMSTPAQGTAASETLHMLGMENTDKSVIFSIIKAENAETVLQALEDKFQTLRGGKGIAFTTPLSSVVGVAIYRFLSNNKMPVKEEKQNGI
jgi:nitrogen regulatory protein PII